MMQNLEEFKEYIRFRGLTPINCIETLDGYRASFYNEPVIDNQWSQIRREGHIANCDLHEVDIVPEVIGNFVPKRLQNKPNTRNLAPYFQYFNNYDKSKVEPALLVSKKSTIESIYNSFPKFGKVSRTKMEMIQCIIEICDSISERLKTW